MVPMLLLQFVPPLWLLQLPGVGRGGKPLVGSRSGMPGGGQEGKELWVHG